MMAGRKARGLVALLAAAAVFGPGTARAAPAGLPPDFFGVITSGYESVPEMQREAASGVRSNRVLFNWATIEPSPGVQEWTYYDNFIGNLATAGLQADPQLLGVPSWIARHPSRPPIYTAFQRSQWRRFLGDLAGRYGAHGTFWAQHPTLPYLPLVDWEVWNEPNLNGYWDGRPSPRHYLRLLRLTATGLRSADPGARLGVGGIFPPPRPRYGVSLESFLNRLYAIRGARSAFDAVAIHPYGRRPKDVLAAVSDARRLMNRHHDRGTPLWLTELGWRTGGRNWGRSPFKATEPQQATFLRVTFRRLLRARARLGLARLVWHTWEDYDYPGSPWIFHMGLTRGDGSAKPSLAAFAGIAG